MKNPKNRAMLANGVNTALGLTLLILYGNVILVHGMAGAVSWTLLKLILAPAGVILLLICGIILIIRAVQRKNVMPWLLTLLLSVIVAFPMLMLLNIVPVAYPISIQQASPAITIHSPFREPALVAWGGDTVQDNQPHTIWASERWAYDLVKEPKNTGSHQLEAYGIYDQAIYAPINGIVIAAFDDEEDIEPNTEDFISMAGNHVYIKIDETQTYLLFAHLKQGSVEVKVGDSIQVGDYIGRVGNSGTTSEPHLHIHHQRQDPTALVFPLFAEGLPLYFYDGSDNAIMPTSGELLDNR